MGVGLGCRKEGNGLGDWLQGDPVPASYSLAEPPSPAIPHFEGDMLVTCRGKEKMQRCPRVKFYRDEKLLHFSKNLQPLFLGTATASSSGRYNCTGGGVNILETGY